MAIVARVTRSQPNEELEGFELIPSEFGDIKDIVDIQTDPGADNEYHVTVHSGNFTGITAINVPDYVNVVILPGADFSDGAWIGSVENVVDLNRLGGGSFGPGDDFELPDDLIVNGKLTVRNSLGDDTSVFEENLDIQGDLDTTGDIICQSLTERSSIDFKKDVNALNSEIDSVMKLRPVSFTWKETNEKDVGLIAEEVNEHYPEFVKKDEDGNAVGVNYSKLTTVLIKSIQELKKELDDVKKNVM